MNEEINKLVDKYINEDNRKMLWELAFEYEDKIDLNKIAFYYIKVRDFFNICELICVVSDYLNLDNIFDEIIATNDKTFMFWILNNGSIKSIIDNKYFKKLEVACNQD